MRIVLFHIAPIVLTIFLGCYPEHSQSPTSGTLYVRIAESVAPPVIRQVESFLDLYGDRGAVIHYQVVSSIEAVKSFVRDSIQLSVTVDSLTEAEYQIVDAMEGSFLVRTAALDGIAVVTHPDNPVERIRTTELRDILNGTTTHWSSVESPTARGTIRIVLQGNSDVSRFLERTVMTGVAISSPLTDVRTSKEVMDLVGRDRNAIGFVGTAWLDSSGRELHQPKIFMDHPLDEAWYTVADEASELAFNAHQANIARGYYPLTRRVYLLSRAALGGDLATGLGAYILNSAGQRIFFDAHMIPATQKIRLK